MFSVGKILHRFLQLCFHNGHCPACGRCSTAVGRHRCTCSTAALQHCRAQNLLAAAAAVST